MDTTQAPLDRRPAQTPWAKIVRAGNNCTGVRLTEKEVYALMLDDAIVTRGNLDLDDPSLEWDEGD